MRFLILSAVVVLTLSALLCAGHRHHAKKSHEKPHHEKKHHSTKKHHENVFKKFGEDIKHVADGFAHDIKKGAEDIDHVGKKFGDDVDVFFKHFRSDVEKAYDKAKPFLKIASVVIRKIRKPLKEIEATAELLEILADAA